MKFDMNDSQKCAKSETKPKTFEDFGFTEEDIIEEDLTEDDINRLYWEVCHPNYGLPIPEDGAPYN